ncbi:MAG: AbrB/MazE/SpoVT family DNA-binding domain-containing protein [Candidatus Omnitrophota bacterium]
MLTKIQKWGNSQGLRFPKEILSQAHIAIGDEVDIKLRHGAIVIKPVAKIRGKYNLKNLVSKIPDNHKSEEQNWGKPAGKEEW